MQPRLPPESNDKPDSRHQPASPDQCQQWFESAGLFFSTPSEQTPLQVQEEAPVALDQTAESSVDDALEDRLDDLLEGKEAKGWYRTRGPQAEEVAMTIDRNDKGL